MKILSDLNSPELRYNFGTFVNYYISSRYFSDQKLFYEKNAENLEQKSYILSNLCNAVATIQGRDMVGNIHCLSMCILEISCIYQLCLEYNLFSTVLTLMTEDFCIAIDVTCQIDLLIISTNILPGNKEK